MDESLLNSQVRFLELRKPVAVIPAAYIHDICHQLTGRILFVQEFFDGTELFLQVTGILFLYTVDEVLEIEAVPFGTHAFHDRKPVRRFLLPVFLQAEGTPFEIADHMPADKAPVFIINIQIAAGCFVQQRAVRTAAGNGVLVGPVLDVGHPVQDGPRIAGGVVLVERRHHRLQGFLLDVTEDFVRHTVGRLVYAAVLAADPSRERFPDRFDVFQCACAEEVLFDKANAVFNGAFALVIIDWR